MTLEERTTTERIKSNPAYVVIGQRPDHSGRPTCWGVKGPDGFVAIGGQGKTEAICWADMLNRAFYRGVIHAERQVDVVPGPQSPPRKFHPVEVA